VAAGVVGVPLHRVAGTVGGGDVVRHGVAGTVGGSVALPAIVRDPIGGAAVAVPVGGSPVDRLIRFLGHVEHAREQQPLGHQRRVVHPVCRLLVCRFRHDRLPGGGGRAADHPPQWRPRHPLADGHARPRANDRLSAVPHV